MTPSVTTMVTRPAKLVARRTCDAERILGRGRGIRPGERCQHRAVDDFASRRVLAGRQAAVLDPSPYCVVTDAQQLGGLTDPDHRHRPIVTAQTRRGTSKTPVPAGLIFNESAIAAIVCLVESRDARRSATGTEASKVGSRSGIGSTDTQDRSRRKVCSRETQLEPSMGVCKVAALVCGRHGLEWCAR
jgi:hypothetical protein